MPLENIRKILYFKLIYHTCNTSCHAKRNPLHLFKKRHILSYSDLNTTVNVLRGQVCNSPTFTPFELHFLCLVYIRNYRKARDFKNLENKNIKLQLLRR